MDHHSLFYHAIENVLNNWTALQMAVQHGMGGINSEEKGRWLIGAIEQYFVENDGLEGDEIENFLSEFLNEEFHTIADDNSIPEVADKFCTFYRLFKDGKLELTVAQKSLPKRNINPVEENVTCQNVIVTSQQTDSQATERIASHQDMDVDMHENSEDEWQTVKRNRKKN